MLLNEDSFVLRLNLSCFSCIVALQLMFLMLLLTIGFEIGCALGAIRLTKKIGPFVCAFVYMIPTDSEASYGQGFVALK